MALAVDKEVGAVASTATGADGIVGAAAVSVAWESGGNSGMGGSDVDGLSAGKVDVALMRFDQFDRSAARAIFCSGLWATANNTAAVSGAIQRERT